MPSGLLIEKRRQTTRQITIHGLRSSNVNRILRRLNDDRNIVCSLCRSSYECRLFPLETCLNAIYCRLQAEVHNTPIHAPFSTSIHVPLSIHGRRVEKSNADPVHSTTRNLFSVSSAALSKIHTRSYISKLLLNLFKDSEGQISGVLRHILQLFETKLHCIGCS